MTDKKSELYQYCGSHHCDNCKLNIPNYWEHECGDGCDDECTCLSIAEASVEELGKALELIHGKEPVPVKHDPVNHPSHYCREGGMESIDEMVLIFGKEAVKWFCLLNAWKYRYRASSKNGEEDLRKSDWYIRKYKELSEE